MAIVVTPGTEKKEFSACLIGCGGVGTVAALVLENSGKAHVTAVLRGKYEIVSKKGWDVDSIDHGKIKGWKPSRVVATVADAASSSTPYNYVVVSTKQLPKISPIASLIAPVVTPGVTTIVLIQNGLDIELPIIAAFPTNTVMSSVSMIGSHIESPNLLIHSAADISTMGTHFHSGLERDIQWKHTVDFADMYRAGGACEVTLTEDMGDAGAIKSAPPVSLNQRPPPS